MLTKEIFLITALLILIGINDAFALNNVFIVFGSKTATGILLTVTHIYCFVATLHTPKNLAIRQREFNLGAILSVISVYTFISDWSPFLSTVCIGGYLSFVLLNTFIFNRYVFGNLYAHK